MAEESPAPALTAHTGRFGCNCKLAQGDLEALLAEARLEEAGGDLLFGVGEDAAARRLGPDLALVQTVDFLTPIVDDPYDFGRVAACNAASDAFATGATENLGCLVTLGLPQKLRDVGTAVLAGMRDSLREMDGRVVGGHTTINPWPLAGGAVTATASPEALLPCAGAEPGDHLLLTKPLGTQPAMAATRVARTDAAEAVRAATTRAIDAIAADAVRWMTTPNRAGATAARGLASAATDVTGFGLRAQVRALAAGAGGGADVTAVPVIRDTPALADLFEYGLATGESAETSGGLLLAVPSERVDDLRAALRDRDVFHRRIGRLVAEEGVSFAGADLEPVA
jgi:selenide,water dikinase